MKIRYFGIAGPPAKSERQKCDNCCFGSNSNMFQMQIHVLYEMDQILDFMISQFISDFGKK